MTSKYPFAAEPYMKATLHYLKKHKASGADGIPAEIHKALDENNVSTLLTLLNEWWSSASIPRELAEKAQVTRLS